MVSEEMGIGCSRRADRLFGQDRRMMGTPAWRGEAAQARILGQLTGLFGIPRMLHKRRTMQRSRTVERATSNVS
jgi:hypothetical protein